MIIVVICIYRVNIVIKSQVFSRIVEMDGQLRGTGELRQQSQVSQWSIRVL